MIIIGNNSDNLSLRLSDGSIHINGEETNIYRLVKFSSLILKLDLLDKLQTKEFNSQRMMSIDELNEMREEYKDDQKKYNSITLSIQQKYAIPFSCLIFGILAVPFGIIFQRSGKEPGYVVCIILMMSYFMFFMFGKRLGEEGIINPLVAIWAPNITFFVIGIYLIYKVANDKSSWLLEISQKITFVFSKKKKYQVELLTEKKTETNLKAPGKASRILFLHFYCQKTFLLWPGLPFPFSLSGFYPPKEL